MFNPVWYSVTFFKFTIATNERRTYFAVIEHWVCVNREYKHSSLGFSFIQVSWSKLSLPRNYNKLYCIAVIKIYSIVLIGETTPANYSVQKSFQELRICHCRGTIHMIVHDCCISLKLPFVTNLNSIDYVSYRMYKNCQRRSVLPFLNKNSAEIYLNVTEFNQTKTLFYYNRE